MGIFRRAGEAIRKFDDGYSAKIAQMYEGSHPVVDSIGSVFGGGIPSFRKAEVPRKIGPERHRERVIRETMEYALPVVNAVPKYALPAVGVTLAGKALIDLTGGLNQQSVGTLPVDY